jgi:protein SHQ1
LPGAVIEDDDSSAKYDISSGMLSIALTKVNRGEHFPDLDMTNRLLARTGEIVVDASSVPKGGPPKIQLLSSLDLFDDDEDLEQALKYDFKIPQQSVQEEEQVSAQGGKYGFNNQYSGHFCHLQNLDLVTLLPEEIEALSAAERWEAMRKREDEKFDRDWYLADLLEPPEDLIEAMRYKVPELQDPFTPNEQDAVRNLGTKDCTAAFWFRGLTRVLIENAKDLYLNLPPLIYAILYDRVTMGNQPTPESPWTISRLTPTLSSLAPVYLLPTTTKPISLLPPLKQIKIALVRRTLTYPLYRTLPLTEKLWNETAHILNGGKRGVIRLFLGARMLFMESEDWSIYNRVVWEDYIIWLQGSKDRVLAVVGKEMEKVVLDLEDIGFGLVSLHDEIEG